MENVSDDGALGTHKEERRFLGAQIKIYTYSRNSRSTYSTVIHELAHASHWNMWRKADDFDDSESIVKESWASGVEWELTRMVYSSYSSSYSRLRYTGVVEDMIDGNKTRTSYYYWTGNNSWVSSTKSYPDRVSSYSIRQIEDALQSKKTWTVWKNNIINTVMEQKQNYMIVLIIGVLISLIYSCDKGEIDKLHKKNYTYANETNFSIKIEDWKSGISKSYNLPPSKQIVFKIELGTGGTCAVENLETSESNCLLVMSDSLKVIFDNTKALILKQDDTRDVNILKEINYSYEKNGQVENFRYAFTQKDYNLAE